MKSPQPPKDRRELNPNYSLQDLMDIGFVLYRKRAESDKVWYSRGNEYIIWDEKIGKVSEHFTIHPRGGIVSLLKD